MKNYIKRIVAFVCILALTIGSVTIWNPVKEVKATDESTGSTPVYLEGFNHVTLEDFGLTEGTYTETKYGQLKDDDGTTPVTGVLDKTVLSLKVDFNQKDTNSYGSPLVIGGDGWDRGFAFRTNKNGTALGILDSDKDQYPMTTETNDGGQLYQAGVLYAADVDTALGTSGFNFYDEFMLQVSLEYTTEGGQTYLTLTFYVNGKQIKVNERITATTSSTKLDSLKMKISSDKKNHGTYIGFDEYSNGGTLKLTSVPVTTEESTGPTPVYLEGFNHVTLDDFGLSEGTYTETKYEQLKDDDGTTPVTGVLDKTVLSLKVDFNQKDTNSYGSPLVIGGAGWDRGFAFRTNKNGTALGILDSDKDQYPMTTETNDGGQLYQAGVLYATDVDAALGTSGFNFYDEFMLQVSFEYTTEGGQTYLTLTFYVNGKQIKVNERITATNSSTKLDSLKMKISSDKKNHGTYIGFAEYGNGGTLKLTSVPVTTEESTGPTPVYLPGFKHVTLEDFGLSEGTYTDTKYEQLKDDDGTTPVTGVLDKTVLSLKVDFNQKDTNSYGSPLVIGGDGWDRGFAFRTNKNGTALGILDSDKDQYPMTTETNDGGQLYQAGVLYATDVDAALGTSGFNFYDEFMLQVSLEYTTEGGQTYLTLTFYVNGKQIKVNERITVTNSSTKLDSLKMKISSDKKNHGTYIGFDEYGNGGTLKLTSVPVTTEESTGPTPVYLEGFKHVTLKDFGLTEGKTYTETTYAQLKGDDGKTPVTGVLDKTVLSLKVKFTQKDTNSYGSPLVIGGDGWDRGFAFRTNKNGTALGILDSDKDQYPMTTETNDGGQVYQAGVLYAADVDTALGTSGFNFYDEFMLQVSFEYTTEGGQTYLTLTFYVNGKQIKINERITVTNSSTKLDSLKMKISSDKKNHGTYIGFDEYGNGGTLTMSSVVVATEGGDAPGPSGPTRLDPDYSFQKLTFSHFNVSNGTYSYVAGEPSLRVLEKTEKSLDKALFSGDFLLAEGKKSDIRYGGIKSEQGLRFEVTGDGRIHVMWISDNGNDYILKNITPAKAQTDLFGDWLNLKISTEIIDADNDGQYNDIRLAIWFNNIAYDNSYYIVSNKAHLLGHYFSIACQEEGSTVQVRSIEEWMDPVNPEDIVKINESFKQITFSHLAIEDGTYAHVAGEPSLRVLGKMKTSVDRTVFSGDVLLAEGKKLNIRYGGNAAEQGLMFEVTGKGTIHLRWIEKGVENPYIVTGITSTKAKTDLFGDWLNLKISTEIIDADKDGQKNDIRMAIWFNDIAYNDRYIIIRDKADLLGSYFSIACQEEGAFVQVRSIPELIEPFDYTLYGLTEDWEDTLLNTEQVAKISVGGSKTSASPTGDRADIVIPIVAISVSAAAILLYVFMKRKEKIEA